MPATTRTFVALELPDSSKDALVRLRSQLEPELAGARWVRTDQYHLTLAFLGDVANDCLPALVSALDNALAPLEPFGLRLAGLGAFPGPSRPRVVWAGLDDPDPAAPLRRVHEAVVTACRAAGAPPADDRFSPHITLARFDGRRGRPPDLTRFLAPQASWSGGAFTASAVTTFASTLGRDGPTHTVLSHSPFRGFRTGEAP